MSTMTIGELISAAQEAAESGELDLDSSAMLDVAGRWTGIKGLTTMDGSLFIESED